MARLTIVAELTAKGHKATHSYVSSADTKTKEDAVLYVENIKDHLLKPFDMKGAHLHCDINLQTDTMWVRRLRYSNGVELLTNVTLI